MVLAAVAVLLLTPFAFIPKPDWTTTSRPATEIQEGILAEETPSASQAPGGIDLLKLARLMKPTRPDAVEQEATAFGSWRVVALVGLAAAGLGVARLAIGFVFVFMTLRRSRPVTDPGLIATADELRTTLACRRTVRLRESSRVGSGATAGWLRPVVLLSPMWRTWSPAERRAVIAHELAHVARGDFVGRLAARLAVALHGYHPLVRWLAARLELRQEMAADARAASACHGRPAYLKCLAGLALKADARPLGPVPTFLSRPRTLFRRIAMLRVTDDTTARRRRWPGVAIALLGVAALALHGSRPQAVAGPVVPAKFIESKEKRPLDASFVMPADNPDEVGIFALRVGDLVRTPGMEKIVATYGPLLPAVFEEPKLFFELGDIEQIAGRVTIKHDPKQPRPNRSLMMSLDMIRMAKDFDWVKQLKAWTTDWTEHAHGGAKYYSGKFTSPVLGLTETPMWFYLPDGRTVVLASQDSIKKLIDAKGKPAAAPWADDWKSVAGGTFAMVLPDVRGKLGKKLSPDESKDEMTARVVKSIGVIAGKTSRASVGVEVGTGCSITVRLACGSAADATDVDAGCQALTKLAEAALAGPEPTEPVDKAGHKFSAMLARGIEFGKTVDHVVEIRMTAESGLADLLKAVGSK
jgi:beta-lactamase regulating signal transducer with metallopeptidase domain